MTEYKDRTYRDGLKLHRWHHFTVRCKETDLWIAVDTPSFKEEMEGFCQTFVQKLRKEMDDWIVGQEGYASAFTPVETPTDAPKIFRKMSEVAHTTGIGPMSAVAGAVAECIGVALKERFRVAEVIIENGGDIYVDLQNDINIGVFAGKSPLTGKVGVRIPARETPLGICTSSGTVGPSLSFGKADAMMIICKDVLLADSYATAFANLVQTENDIDEVIEKVSSVDTILSAIIIKNEKIGISGVFDFIGSATEMNV